jgi:ParB/RepB/Spo0J family partition protein
MKKTKGIEAQRKIECRSLSTLTPHPDQARLFGDLPDAELKALAEDIRENGLKELVEIRPTGTIIAGHQRVRAAELLGWTEIQCWVREDLEMLGETAIKRRLIGDNLYRRQSGLIAQARLYAELKKMESGKRRPHDDDLRDILAKQFGLSGRTLDRRARILLDTPIEVQRACEAGTLNLGLAEKVASLSQEEREAIAQALREGKGPNKVVKACLNKSKDAAKQQTTDTRRLVRNFVKNMEELAKIDEYPDLRYYHGDLETLRQGRKVIDALAKKIKADHVAHTEDTREYRECSGKPGPSRRRGAKRR